MESQEWWVRQKEQSRGTKVKSREWWVVDWVEYQKGGRREVLGNRGVLGGNLGNLGVPGREKLNGGPRGESLECLV